MTADELNRRYALIPAWSAFFPIGSPTNSRASPALFTPPDTGAAISGPVSAAHLDDPRLVACASNGDVYVTHGNQVRLINRQGTISTGLQVARVGSSMLFLDTPTGIVIDAQGRLVIAESGANRVTCYDPSARSTTLIAGTGTAGFKGDGAAATDAQLFSPGDLAFDSNESLLIADRGNQRIRKVTADGSIHIIAKLPLELDSASAQKAH